MKKLILTLALLTISVSAFSQLSTKQNPRSFKMYVNEQTIPLQTLEAPDVDFLLAEDEENAKTTFKPQRCATHIAYNANFFDKAMHIALTDADLYLLKIHIPYAQALNIYANNFYIPKGGELYLWNPDHTKVLGAFTSDNNNDEGLFATDYVYGDEMIIEYYQPKTTHEKASFNINEFGYFYRDVINFEEAKSSYEFRSSGTCNVNANCSEGNDYRDIQRAVCRILVYMGSYGSGWCTGTLINNTNDDKTPYVISAGHCVEYTTTASQYNNFVFYFNYESNGCSTPSTEPSYTSLSGCTRLAYDNSYATENSDYLLVKLKSSIPASINAYWVGWTKNTTMTSGGIDFHHPAGDIKKVSTFTSTPTSAQYPSATSTNKNHWKVKWVSTSNGFGITEGGSSGSGIFNREKKLFGTLSGGYSDCEQSASYQYDFFGKFSISFTYLSQWLDPTNSGVQEMNGRSYNSASSLEEIKDGISLSVYPIPAKDKISINLENLDDDAVVSVLDNLGRTLLSQKISMDSKRTILDISSLEQGTYFIRAYSNKNSVIKKITKE